MRIGIFANPRRDPGAHYARAAREYITARGHFAVDAPAPQPCDCWLVLGGDGTMLRAARQCPPNTPLLGINLGNLGHLTAANKTDLEPALTDLFTNNYHIQPRMRLRTRHETALNDIVIKSPRLTRYTVTADHRPLTEIRADGIILATPTGATAYNRSAGGPLLPPTSQLIALTPICPADLSPPWVLSGTSLITLRADQETAIEADGVPITLLAAGEALVVQRADLDALIIKRSKE